MVNMSTLDFPLLPRRLSGGIFQEAQIREAPGALPLPQDIGIVLNNGIRGLNRDNGKEYGN